MLDAPTVRSMIDGPPGPITINPGPGPSSPIEFAPRAGWPQKATMDYLKVGIELLLLLLAVPWIVRELTRHPRKASRGAAATHVKGIE